METKSETAKMENNFGVLDSLWFGIGALMQQGSDVSPRSISTRYFGVYFQIVIINAAEQYLVITVLVHIQGANCVS